MWSSASGTGGTYLCNGRERPFRTETFCNTFRSTIPVRSSNGCLLPVSYAQTTKLSVLLFAFHTLADRVRLLRTVLLHADMLHRARPYVHCEGCRIVHNCHFFCSTQVKQGLYATSNHSESSILIEARRNSKSSTWSSFFWPPEVCLSPSNRTCNLEI